MARYAVLTGSNEGLEGLKGLPPPGARKWQKGNDDPLGDTGTNPQNPQNPYAADGFADRGRALRKGYRGFGAGRSPPQRTSAKIVE